MRKIITICLLAICVHISGKPTRPVEVVQAYADNLSAWCATKDVSRYSDAIKELCSDGFRVNDEIVCDWAKQKKMQKMKHYDYNDYEMCLQELINKGVRIKISNISIDNSAEFNVVNYGQTEPLAFVSGDITIEGAANYHSKEIFKVRGGKIAIIRNYESDLTLSKAFLFCKLKRYQEAYNAFEQLMMVSNSYGEKYVAQKFATSILLKKSGQLKMDSYIRKYKLARCFLYDYLNHINSDPDYPVLDQENYSYYSMNYERAIRDRHRSRVLLYPHNWKKWIPYTSNADIENVGVSLCSGRHVCLYYEWIHQLYRNPEKNIFPKISGKLYGFVNESGREVIKPQFAFAYPFDEKHGLAAVQGRDGKWGYIDIEGRPRTSMNYDVVSDAWVNDRTLVIKDGYLMLINNQGQIISSIYGYTDIAHKLDKDVTLVKKTSDNIQYDLFDFNGELLAENILKKNKEKKVQEMYHDYDVHSIFKYYEDVVGCSLSWETFHKVIGSQIPNPDVIGKEKIVDLGLSVKWAAWNLGANSPEEEGLHCGWGDPTGIDQTGKSYKEWKKKVVDPKTNKWISQSYGGPNPPANICGTSLDVARNLWGKGWRLPSVAECKELKEKCKWQRVTYKGVEGYLITGPTGKCIFMKSMKYTGYWTGELHPKWQKVAQVFRSGEIVEENMRSRAGCVSGGWYSDSHRPCVRPVYEY